MHLSHINISMPKGNEAIARSFYAGLLGLREIPKPEPLRVRGGVWFDAGGLDIHVSVEEQQGAADRDVVESAEGGDLRNIYKVGLNTTRLLMMLGDVVCAWLMLRGAEVALEKLGGSVSEADKHFYEGKVAAAQFFAHHNLPKLSAELAIAQATDLSLMDLDEASF